MEILTSSPPTHSNFVIQRVRSLRSEGSMPGILSFPIVKVPCDSRVRMEPFFRIRFMSLQEA